MFARPGILLRIMAKRKDEKEPEIQDFVRLYGGTKRDGTDRRRSITLWLDGAIIDACKPTPARSLRRWIEKHFPKK